MKNELLIQCIPELKDFFVYMEIIKGKSPKTVEEYFYDLRTFFRYILKQNDSRFSSCSLQEIDISNLTFNDIKSVTLSDVYGFMNYITNTNKNNAATRSRKVSSLRAFYKYLTLKANKLSENPLAQLDTPKLKKTLPKYLTLDQCIELLQCIDGEYKTRNYCIITLFLNTGMRLSELCGLNLKDINNSENTMVVTGKGNKQRIIYLNESSLYTIKKYLEVRPRDGVKDKDALFISRNGNRINQRSVEMMVDKYLIASGLKSKGFSVHKLRHTAATLMYQNGVDIRILKEILGHENLGTTEIYTHLANKQLEDAVKVNPLANIAKTQE